MSDDHLRRPRMTSHSAYRAGMTEVIEDWLAGGPNLLRVIELNERTTSREGLGVIWVSLEVWDGVVALTTMNSQLDRSGKDEMALGYAWEIRDDAGTTYKFESSAGTGDSLGMTRRTTWTPSPPEGATLTISNDMLGGGVTVEL